MNQVFKNKKLPKSQQTQLNQERQFNAIKFQNLTAKEMNRRFWSPVEQNAFQGSWLCPQNPHGRLSELLKSVTNVPVVRPQDSTTLKLIDEIPLELPKIN